MGVKFSGSGNPQTGSGNYHYNNATPFLRPVNILKPRMELKFANRWNWTTDASFILTNHEIAQGFFLGFRFV